MSQEDFGREFVCFNGQVVELPGPDLPYLNTKEVEDYEVEKERCRIVWVTDEHGFPVQEAITETNDYCSTSDPYFTKSGNNPVIEDLAQVNDDKRSAGGFTDCTDAPWINFYSDKPYHRKSQQRKAAQWISWIWKHQADQERIQEGWKRFWKIWYARKIQFVSPRDKDLIAELLKRFGAKARNSK